MLSNRLITCEFIWLIYNKILIFQFTSSKTVASIFKCRMMIKKGEKQPKGNKKNQAPTFNYFKNPINDQDGQR